MIYFILALIGITIISIFIAVMALRRSFAVRDHNKKALDKKKYKKKLDTKEDENETKIDNADSDSDVFDAVNNILSDNDN